MVCSQVSSKAEPGLITSTMTAKPAGLRRRRIPAIRSPSAAGGNALPEPICVTKLSKPLAWACADTADFVRLWRDHAGLSREGRTRFAHPARAALRFKQTTLLAALQPDCIAAGTKLSTNPGLSGIGAAHPAEFIGSAQACQTYRHIRYIADHCSALGQDGIVSYKYTF